ncbi:MAG: RidA family protein [Bryobacterales bacterium]
MRTLALFCLTTAFAAAQGTGPAQSPALLADGYLYVSAQGPGRESTEPPETQAEQALQKVIGIVQALGLPPENIVYTQVYMENLADLPAVDEAFSKAFPQDPPARAVLGVAGLPDGPIAIRAVAVADRTGVEAVQVSGYSTRGYSAGMLTADRLYLSSLPAKPGEPATAVDRALDAFEAITKAAGLDLRHVVFVNPYVTDAISYGQLNEAYAKRFEFGNTPARATIFVAGLPSDPITFTGVAVRNLADRQAVRPKNMPPSPTASPCVLARDTLFCSAKSGFIPGPNSGIYASTVEHQLRQTMRNLLDGLEEADMGFANVVQTTVYLDDLAELSVVDPIYGEYFESAPPARAVLQQAEPNPASRQPGRGGRYGTLEQISLIAVRR